MWYNYNKSYKDTLSSYIFNRKIKLGKKKYPLQNMIITVSVKKMLQKVIIKWNHDIVGVEL